MKTNNIVVFFFIIFFSSCFHTYYSPVTQNVPLFREKGEIKVTAIRGFSEFTAANWSIQSAYAITEKYAVMANYMATVNYNSFNNCFETAFGIYKPMGENGVFEIYTGMGRGNQYHDYEIYFNQASSSMDNGNSSLSYRLFFVQSAVGITTNGFDIAISSRLCGLNFYKITNNIVTQNLDYNELNYLSKNRTSLLFEPALTIRGGWKYLKLNLQFLNSTNLVQQDLLFEPFRINLGLTYAFANRYKKSKKSTKF